MIHTFGSVLAAAATFAALGTATAHAQTFSTADITIDRFGFLDCSFKETGLSAGATINYTCGATDVGWLTQCFLHNRPVVDSLPVLHVAHDVTTEQPRVASNNGTIRATILTAYPAPEEEIGPEPCTEPAVETVTAIRWCNASLTDQTDNIVGAAEPDLFLQLERNGDGDVPACAELAMTPATP